MIEVNTDVLVTNPVDFSENRGVVTEIKNYGNFQNTISERKIYQVKLDNGGSVESDENYVVENSLIKENE